MIRPAAIALLLAAVALAGTADAQTTKRFQLLGQKVALDCHIIQLKEMVVTNLTPSPIAAGTTISFDATRYWSGEHYSGSFTSPALGSGASVHRGTDQSTSCTAWYYKPLFNNLQQYQLKTE
jgi:hypothetical protein